MPEHVFGEWPQAQPTFDLAQIDLFFALGMTFKTKGQAKLNVNARATQN